MWRAHNGCAFGLRLTSTACGVGLTLYATELGIDGAGAQSSAAGSHYLQLTELISPWISEGVIALGARGVRQNSGAGNLRILVLPGDDDPRLDLHGIFFQKDRPGNNVQLYCVPETYWTGLGQR